jgi:hypothetical protein
MASIIAHELEETTSDPDLNAWYDAMGNENADKCAWSFGTTYPSGGGFANMRLGTRDYMIQQNWVNASGGYCALSAPGVFTRTYGTMQGSTGALVTIQNTGVSTISNIGGQCNDYGSRITSGLVSSLRPGASMTVQASLGSSYHCGFQFWGTNASNSPYNDPTF